MLNLNSDGNGNLTLSNNLGRLDENIELLTKDIHAKTKFVRATSDAITLKEAAAMDDFRKNSGKLTEIAPKDKFPDSLLNGASGGAPVPAEQMTAGDKAKNVR